jgi:hypothetical protein
VSPKNDSDFLKIFSWENILVKSPYYEKGKQGKYIFPLFLQPPNLLKKNSLKKNFLTLPNTNFNQIPLFFKFIKTPYLKKTRCGIIKNQMFKPLCFPHPICFEKLTPKFISSTYF